MPRSKAEILKDVSARFGPDGLALLNEMFTAFENDWKDGMVSASGVDAMLQYQGRIRALREIGIAVKPSSTPHSMPNPFKSPKPPKRKGSSPAKRRRSGTLKKTNSPPPSLPTARANLIPMTSCARRPTATTR